MSALASHMPAAKLKAAAVITLVVLLLTCGLAVSGVLTPFRLKTLDLLFRHVPLAPPSNQVVVVTVDQPDLDFFQAQGVVWPWPRQLYAPIVDFCRRAGARAVIFDILFTEASSYGPDDDQRLAAAVSAAGNVVLPVFLSREEKPSNPAASECLQQAGLPLSGPAPGHLAAYRSAVAPVPCLLHGSRALGNVECRPDDDGIYRSLPLVLPDAGGHWLPLLAVAAFRQFQPDAGGPVRFEAGDLVLGRHRIPLDSQGRLLLKFRGPSRTHKRYSAANLIKSEEQLRRGLSPVYPLEDFAGKWVILGLTAPGLMDLKAAPVGAVYPGAEIHATLLDNLLQGDFLRPLPGWALGAWAALLAAAVALAVLFSPGLVATLGALGLLAFLNVALAVLAFLLSRWADPVLPGAALGLSFALAAAYSYATEGRQKQFIRRTFAQYMSETVINHLLAHPEKLQLGGERRRVTLFFSDLAGFTTLSERYPPETVVALLNDYLSRMTEIILEEAGAVDKFEGDAIMAFWGAPLDQPGQARLACRAALRQTRALSELNEEFARRRLPPLKLRIGLHTGDAVVGNLGSAKRFDYTVIGDTVNLASRLEGLNKFYGTAVMASEETVKECGGAAEFRELDLVAVKGREGAVRVFEVVALTGEITPEQDRLRQDFREALDLYRGGDFAAAASAFQAILARHPEDGPSKTFAARCRSFLAAPPPAGWDAVFRPDAK